MKTDKNILEHNIKILEIKTGFKRRILFMSAFISFTLMMTSIILSIFTIINYNEDGYYSNIADNEIVINNDNDEYFKIESDAKLLELPEIKGELVYAGRYDEIPKGSKYDRLGLPTNRKWLTASEWQGKHLKDPLDKSMFKAWKVIHMTTFLDYIKQAALEESKVTEFKAIPASLIAAQAILESGFGVSRLAVDADNLFGHKCHDCIDTAKFIIAHDDSPDDKFRVKNSKWNSIRDHSKLLMSKYFHRIPDNRKANPDVKDWLNALCNCGRELSVTKAKQAKDKGKYSYATSCYTGDKGYARKIIEYIDLYKLDRLDK